MKICSLTNQDISLEDVAKIHNDLGHVGETKLSSFFKETGKLNSNVQKLIKEAVSSCIQCASRKVTRNLNEKKGFISPKLFHTITMDIAGPLPQTKSESRFILSIGRSFIIYILRNSQSLFVFP